MPTSSWAPPCSCPVATWCVLAKELAGLDRLSGGRLLVTFVPGLPRQPESAATGVAGGDKGSLMDEMLPVLRQPVGRGVGVPSR